MYTAISVLIFIICVLLILIVLVQNSKGGGLASSFASSNQIMGVRKTTDFLEKATWTLAGGMMILCVLATFFILSVVFFLAQNMIRRKCCNIQPYNDVEILRINLKIKSYYKLLNF